MFQRVKHSAGRQGADVARLCGQGEKPANDKSKRCSNDKPGRLVIE